MTATAQTQWWDQWPGAQRIDETFRADHRAWLQNHRAHWGQPDLPAGSGPVEFHSRRIQTADARLHVFVQYELLHARIADHRRNSEDLRKRSASLIGQSPDPPILITGTPGIGKSVFIYYYAIRLMRQATPFVVYTGDRVYIVTADGVILAPMDATQDDHNPFLDSMFNVPFLFDVDRPTTVPSESFVARARFFFVHAASPNPAHFNWARGLTRARKFVMNPPLVDEVVQLLNEDHPADVLERVIEAYGPNIRVVLEALDPYLDPLATLEAAVDQLHPSDLEDLQNAASRIQTHVLIKTICPDPPYAFGPRWLGPDKKVHVIANPTAMRLILSRWLCVELLKTLEMLRRLSGLPQTAPSAGWLFESWAHAQLCKAGIVTLHPMEKSGRKYVVKELSATAVNFPQLRSRPFANIDDASATNTYYIPTAMNNPTFDAFCRLDDDAYAFQMTLAKTHTLKDAGLKILKTGMSKSTTKNFVFVIPRGRPFSFTAPPKMLIPDLKFWVVYIDLDDSARSAIESTYDYWDENERLDVAA